MKVNIAETQVPRLVIVGGGFGGIHLARALKKADLQIVLFDKQNYHTFQPLLYQVATAGLEPDSIAFPLRKIFKGQSNFVFRMAEVLEVVPEQNLIRTSIGDVGYDYLVLATGSRTNFFGLQDVARNAMQMKSIPQALDLRSLMLQNFERALLTTDLQEREALMNFAVVGAGPTGVETAGALGELKKHVLPKDYPELDLRRMQIHLIEAMPQVLNGMSSEASGKALTFLKKLDVKVWLGSAVASYDGRIVRTNKGKELRAATMIWAAGVVGETIRGLPEEHIVKGSRIGVDAFNRVAGTGNVFAIGDVAAMMSDELPAGHPMVAQVAIQQARLMAKNLKRLILNQKPEAFIYRDKGTMATIGRNKAVVDLKHIRFQGFFAWLVWMLVHLVSLIGFRGKLVVFVNWLWNYISYDRETRLIIRPYARGLDSENAVDEKQG